MGHLRSSSCPRQTGEIPLHVGHGQLTRRPQHDPNLGHHPKLGPGVCRGLLFHLGNLGQHPKLGPGGCLGLPVHRRDHDPSLEIGLDTIQPSAPQHRPKTSVGDSTCDCKYSRYSGQLLVHSTQDVPSLSAVGGLPAMCVPSTADSPPMGAATLPRAATGEDDLSIWVKLALHTAQKRSKQDALHQLHQKRSSSSEELTD